MYGPPVDADLYEAVAKNCGADYAFSYLSKARQIGNKIEPYTLTAWERLKENRAAMSAISNGKYVLKKPVTWFVGRDPYGSPLPPTKF